MSRVKDKVLAAALALILSAPALQADDGTWIDFDLPAEPARDSLEALVPDTLVSVEDVNPFRFWDSGVFLFADSTLLEESAPRPLRDLDFLSVTLQETLRRQPLADEENQACHEMFRVDSLLALSLFQIRGEEYPHYDPQSDLWYYIWRGRGVFSLEGIESDYGPGQILQVPAGSEHAFHNKSGAPTVSLLWQSPPLVDSLRVDIIPEDVLEKMEADSLRDAWMQERSLYKSGR